MKRLIPIFTLMLLAFGLSSCYTTDVPDTNKITYIVTGEHFDVIYQNPSGEFEHIYDREGVFKVSLEDAVGDPLFLLAKGSDDCVVHIRVKDGIDTLRRAKTTGSDLVYINLSPEDTQ